MPRYYFRIHDGRSIFDTDEMVLANTSEARRTAIRISGQYFVDDADLVSLAEEWRMDVTDERGLILFRLDFVVTDAASVGGSVKG